MEQDYVFHLVYNLVPNLEAIIFISAAIVGNAAIIFFGTLSGYNVIPLWKVLVFSFLASLSTETLWFSVGKYMEKKELLKKYINRKLTKNILILKSDFQLLVLSRVVYGTKIAVLIFLGRRGVPFRRFLLYNFPISFLWISILCIAGWLFGKGFSRAKIILDNFIIFVSIAVITAVVIQVIIKILSKRFKKT